MIVLLDVMDTLIPDPFYRAVVELAGSLENFSRYKQPDAYLEFERGRLAEEDYLNSFYQNENFVREKPFTTAEFRREMLKTPPLHAGVLDLLKKMKPLAPVYLASNYGPWLDVHVHNLGLWPWLNGVFVSWQTGYRKPEAEFFLHIIRQLKVEPAELLLVDDQEKNLEGAARLGLQVLPSLPGWPDQLWQRLASVSDMQLEI